MSYDSVVTSYAWLPLTEIAPAVPLMQHMGVSKVARSSRGFLTAYRTAGSPQQLNDAWVRKRRGFIARHMAQVRARREPLWMDGQPTRRHLALVAWAYTPDRARWREWIRQRRGAMRDNPAELEVVIDDDVVDGLDSYTRTHWGVRPTKIYKVDDPDVPSVLVQMGKLRSLYVEEPDGTPVEYEFAGKNSVAFTNDEATRLYLVLTPSERKSVARTVRAYGRARTLRAIANEIGGRQCEWTYPNVRARVAGVLTHIVYETTKEGDGLSHYIHEMGEDRGGIQPALCVDNTGRLWVVGGSYVVTTHGIEN